MKPDPEHSRLIENKALEIGFDACGFSKATFLEKESHILENWISEDKHAGMDWMLRNREARTDPRILVPGAKTVVSLMINYFNPEMQDDPSAPVLSRYAYGRDYHKVVKKKLLSLLKYIQELVPGTEGRAFVDSAPVMEHAWAVKAGLGWIGKNSLLLNREFGSYFFLGELIIDLELDYNNGIKSDHCGTCTLCVNECPTRAIGPNRTVDARKCISYLSIEHKGPLPTDLRSNFFNRVFGCDICQDVCPWNRELKPHTITEFLPTEELMKLNKAGWLELDQEAFDRIFHQSAVKRAGYHGLRRNIEFLEGESLRGQID